MMTMDGMGYAESSFVLQCGVMWRGGGGIKKGMNALISRDKSINFPPLSTQEAVFTISRYELTMCSRIWGAHFGGLSL